MNRALPTGSVQKDTRYEADNDDSNTRSHSHLKKPKQYVSISEEENESGELEDDKDRDPDYNPMKIPFSKTPEELARKLNEALRQREKRALRPAPQRSHLWT